MKVILDILAAVVVATGIMIVLLLITRYMSLSTTLAMLLCPILLIPFGASVPVILMALACAVFMAVRHKENFKRLIKGTESKFTLKGKKNDECIIFCLVCESEGITAIALGFFQRNLPLFFGGLFRVLIVKNYLGGRVLPENAGVVIFLSICYTIFRSKAELTVIM